MEEEGKNRQERKGASGHTKGNLLLDSSRKKQREQIKGCHNFILFNGMGFVSSVTIPWKPPAVRGK